MTISIPDHWIEKLMRCENLSEPDMKTLCERVRCILMEESNIQPVSSPVTICGDIHGQYWDLLELLRKGGKPPDTSYIFMARRCSPTCTPLDRSDSRRVTLSTAATIVSRRYHYSLR